MSRDNYPTAVQRGGEGVSILDGIFGRRARPSIAYEEPPEREMKLGYTLDAAAIRDRQKFTLAFGPRAFGDDLLLG